MNYNYNKSGNCAVFGTKWLRVQTTVRKINVGRILHKRKGTGVTNAKLGGVESIVTLVSCCVSSPNYFRFIFFPAICFSGCANGGSCTAPNTCTCALGWGGSDCTTDLCAVQPCQHNGTCIGLNFCNCPTGWGDNSCQTRKYRFILHITHYP